jgi:hypothetical protein
MWKTKLHHETVSTQSEDSEFRFWLRCCLPWGFLCFPSVLPGNLGIVLCKMSAHPTLLHYISCAVVIIKEIKRMYKYCTVLAVLVRVYRLSHLILSQSLFPDFTVGVTIALLQLKACRTLDSQSLEASWSLANNSPISYNSYHLESLSMVSKSSLR